MTMTNKETSTRNILFICTGNTCRSCMAEGIFRAFSQQESELKELAVASRGIQAFDGDPASLHSVTALKKLWGIDISIHRAKSLLAEDMNSAQLVLTMTRQHRDFLKANFRDKSSAIFTLKEYAYPNLQQGDSALDIRDPYGMPYSSYETCAIEIYESVRQAIKRLI